MISFIHYCCRDITAITYRITLPIILILLSVEMKDAVPYTTITESVLLALEKYVNHTGVVTTALNALNVLFDTCM